MLPYERTSVPGVYRRGSKDVVVYRVDGRQRKETADTLTEARALRRGPTLHSFGLEWLDAYAGTGHDTLRENTRQEYRRLLMTFALEYFDGEVRMRDLDRRRLQGFVDWLTSKPASRGRLKDAGARVSRPAARPARRPAPRPRARRRSWLW